MSSKKKKKENAKRLAGKPQAGKPRAAAGANAGHTGAAREIAVRVPVLPLAMMCAMTVSALAADIIVPGMEEGQYVFFPGLFRWIDYAVVLCGLVYYGWALYRRSVRPGKTDILFIAFAALIVISTLVNGLTREAVHGIPYRNIGIFNTLAFLLVYMGMSGREAAESLREKATLLYLGAADIVGAAALTDLYIAEIPAFHAKKELSAIFFNGNHYGYFLLMAVLAGIGWYMYGEGRKAVFGAASAALNLLLLVLNHSMGCMLAAVLVIAGMAVCVMRYDRDKSRKLAALAGALVICAGAAVLLSSGIRGEIASLGSDIAAILSGTAGGSTGHNRFMLWDLTLGYIGEHPLIGSGCEAIAFPLHEATGRSNPHSELLTYAAYYGIPAALCYLAGVIGVFAGYFRGRKDAPASARIACMAAAGYFISSLTGVAMFYTAPFFFIFIGMTRRKA